MKDLRRKKKILLAVCCVLIASLFMCGCMMPCVAFAMMNCAPACAACIAKGYPFIHEAENFDDVVIELVTVEYVENENSEYGDYVINSAKVIADEEKEAFLREFNALKYILPYGAPITIIDTGKAFCFTWPDGQTEVVTTYGCALYTDRSLEEKISDYGLTSPEEEFYALWDKWAQAQ